MTSPLNLVFGGKGLIGRALTRELRAAGEEVEIYDLKDGWDLRTKPPAKPKRVAFCWFLAWDVGGANYIMDPSSQVAILRSNLALCDSVFAWLQDNGLPFLFTSTQMVGYPNAYGLTKQLAEYWSERLPRAQVCRLWNVYGPEPHSVRSHVISDLVHQGRSGQIRLQTNGEERRQFLASGDCARALVHQRAIGQPFADITSGNWLRIREVAETVASMMKARLEVKDKPGYETMVEPTRRLENWEPRISLREGIGEVIESLHQTQSV